MATWPSSPTLPTWQNLLKDSYQAGMPENTRLQTNMGVGPPKFRVRSSAGVDPFAGEMFMTTAQLSSFKTFYNITISQGTIEFDATHPETSAACTMIFIAQPTWTPLGMGWRVNMQMGILP